jgi:hypothetical protein
LVALTDEYPATIRRRQRSFIVPREDTRHHTVLPVPRWGSGRRAVDGGEPAQARNIDHEAGVREQL